jgi:phosphomevalonate kinase
VIEVKAPGKIMLAGEWSILEPGHSCIVLPVNRFVTVRIQESKKIIFNSEDIGLKNVILQWAPEDLMGHLTVDPVLPEQLMAKFNVCVCAVKNCLQFLAEQGIAIKPFELSVYSELSGVKIDGSNFVKPGLGSSAAVTVAVCKAILKFHDLDIDSVCHPELVSGSMICRTFKNLELIFKLACL